jgi:phosphatidylglycerol---prolipoprotein diacylglyceryl transferase
MYPNLYYAFKDIFGLNIPALKVIQSFGFFVALSFLLGAWAFSKELKRKEENGQLQPGHQKVLKGEKASATDLFFSALIGFILGYKILYIALNFNAFTENTHAFLLSPDGNLLGGILGASLSAYSRYREKEKSKLDKPVMVNELVHPYDLVGNMTVIAAVFGLLGAKIFHNLENLEDFAKDPIDALLSFSGLTMYGGLIFGAIAVIWYAKKNKIYIPHLIDASAPGLMLAYGVGRIGCQVAGDGDWGIDNHAAKPKLMSFLPDWTWGYHYPHNVNEVGVPIPGCHGHYCNMLPDPVFPTPLYESVACIALFFVLWSIRKKISIPGVLFCIYLMMNGFERFWIEKIRINTVYQIFGRNVTQAEIISVFLFLLGIIGIFYFKALEKRKAKTGLGSIL